MNIYYFVDLNTWTRTDINTVNVQILLCLSSREGIDFFLSLFEDFSHFDTFQEELKESLYTSGVSRDFIINIMHFDEYCDFYHPFSGTLVYYNSYMPFQLLSFIQLAEKNGKKRIYCYKMSILNILYRNELFLKFDRYYLVLKNKSTKSLIRTHVAKLNIFNIFNIKLLPPLSVPLKVKNNPSAFEFNCLGYISNYYYSYTNNSELWFKDVTESEIFYFLKVCLTSNTFHWQIVAFYKIFEGTKYFKMTLKNILNKRNSSCFKILVNLLKQLKIINVKEIGQLCIDNTKGGDKLVKKVLSRLVICNEVIIIQPLSNNLMILFYLFYLKNSVNGVNMEGFFNCLTSIFDYDLMDTYVKFNLNYMQLKYFLDKNKDDGYLKAPVINYNDVQGEKTLQDYIDNSEIRSISF